VKYWSLFCTASSCTDVQRCRIVGSERRRLICAVSVSVAMIYWWMWWRSSYDVQTIGYGESEKASMEAIPKWEFADKHVSPSLLCSKLGSGRDIQPTKQTFTPVQSFLLFCKKSVMSTNRGGADFRRPTRGRNRIRTISSIFSETAKDVSGSAEQLVHISLLSPHS
jgi:hypothetical protein